MSKEVQEYLKNLEKIKKEKSVTGEAFFQSEDSHNYQVKLVPDKSMKPAQFKPIPHLANQYYAHPSTIRALKKNIFALDDESILEELINCPSCQSTLDKQYWRYCPYCESDLS